jgi:hypothetical protein
MTPNRSPSFFSWDGATRALFATAWTWYGERSPLVADDIVVRAADSPRRRTPRFRLLTGAAIATVTAADVVPVVPEANAATRPVEPLLRYGHRREPAQQLGDPARHEGRRRSSNLQFTGNGRQVQI